MSSLKDLHPAEYGQMLNLRPLKCKGHSSHPVLHYPPLVRQTEGYVNKMLKISVFKSNFVETLEFSRKRSLLVERKIEKNDLSM